MSQERGEASTGAEYGNPAVGIITDESTIDSTIRTIIRAKDWGRDVIVVNTIENEEAIRIFRQLGATVVDPVDRSDDGHRAALIDAARNRNYRGILIHDEDEWADFEACRDELRERSEYAVPAGTTAPPESPDVGLLVGIPAYNEEIGIGSTIIGAQRYADEVVVIDDGSEDRTVEIARKTGATVLEHESNKGKGRALNTFFTYACSTDHDEIGRASCRERV